MADPGIVYFYANFVRFRCFDFNVFDREVFACFPSYGSLTGVKFITIFVQWKYGVPCR